MISILIGIGIDLERVGGGPSGGSGLLLETSPGYLLLESGSFLLLE